MSRPRFRPRRGTWVRTPDGAGEVLAVDAARGAYRVLIFALATECSADAVREYQADEVAWALPPLWWRIKRTMERRSG